MENIEFIYDSGNIKNYSFELNPVEQVIENINNILSRLKNNVPNNRDKGIDSRVVDMPIFIARALLTQDILEQIEAEEPNFIVEEVSYLSNFMIGQLKVKIKGVINI